MKRLFISGHKGFLGSSFVKKYEDTYKIFGYDLVDGDDLLDYQKLVERMNGCDTVVHLAAIPKPVQGKSIDDYFENNVRATLNVANAAVANGVTRMIYASSTTYYGIERDIPFKRPITEDQAVLSQYLGADDHSTRDIDLSYHVSKVMSEQLMAWFGLNKKLQTAALRFGPIDKVFLGTSISLNNAVEAIYRAVECEEELWYEAFSVVDDRATHIDNSKIKKMLGVEFEDPEYSPEQIRSELE